MMIQRRHITKLKKKNILNSISYYFIFHNTRLKTDILLVTEKTKVHSDKDSVNMVIQLIEHKH